MIQLFALEHLEVSRWFELGTTGKRYLTTLLRRLGG